MSSETSVAAAISEMVCFFIPHCGDVTSLNELRSMAEDHAEWRKAHDLFDRIRNKTLKADKNNDRVLQHQYSFEEIYAKTLYNLSGCPAPFDDDSPFWVIPIAGHLHVRLVLMIHVPYHRCLGREHRRKMTRQNEAMHAEHAIGLRGSISRACRLMAVVRHQKYPVVNLDISARASSYFQRVGFSPTRSVPVHPAVPRDHRAFELLACLGGLRIGINENDEMLEEIRNDITFEYTEPDGEIEKWERLLRTRLVGIAETQNGHGLLFLGDDERFFSLSGIYDAMGFNGIGFSDAVDNLFFGQSMPMIRPDQRSVSWYGIEHAPNDAGLYRYDDVS